MAVWVYLEDQSELVPPELLHHYLEGGWSVDDPSSETEEETEEETGEETEEEAPTMEEADTNNSGRLSPDEVRAAAKSADIEGWDTKRIKTLKKELGYDNED